MYQIGDKVVHPMHGAGTIVGIETKKVLGNTHDYYVLQIPIGDMKVMIPIDNLEEIGIRDVSDEQEADRVIQLFKEYEGDVFESNWNKRYRDNISRALCLRSLLRWVWSMRFSPVLALRTI